MSEKKLCKVVFVEKTNTYELWFTDHTGKFDLGAMYATFTKEGDMIDYQYNDVALISENIMWEINKLVDLGYKFLGIERRK